MDVLANLENLRQRIAAASRQAGRDPDTVQLIAVSKGHDVAAVKQALAAGQNVFGENRVQEAAAKFTDLRAAYPALELHLIGPLQTNKVDEAVQLFDVIHTLDRPKLAAALAGAMKKLGRTPRLYVEVNIGEEAQKAGISPAAAPGFLRQCREEYGLKIEGLMCMPPQSVAAQPYFQQLQKMAERLGLPRLSMGMSADFEAAIATGATEIRVGTAIFGPRTGL